jgi:ABC-type amino acid transport system permease subunit
VRHSEPFEHRPEVGLEAVHQVKISALVSAIGVGDLFDAAITAGNSTYRYLESLSLVGLLYPGVGVPLTIALGPAETRVAARWESHAV